MRALVAALLLLAASAAHAQVSLSVSPSSTAKGVAVTITWSGMTGPTSMDWVGLFAPGAANNAYVSFRYLNNQASGSLPFNIPANVASGNHEMRIFRNNTYVLQATSNPLAIMAPSLSVSPSSVLVGGTVTASWAWVGTPSIWDWIGLHATGAADNPYISFRYTGGGSSGSVPFSIPATVSSGSSFELRLFSNNTWTKLAASNTFSISATIAGTLTAGGVPLAGATLTAPSGGSCTNTNGTGEYTCTVPRGWTGSVTPTLAGYAFTPASQSYSNVSSNQSAQNYTAAATTRQVSGTVTDSGNPLAGVAFPATNGAVCGLSNASGQYSCTVPNFWSGTITPLKNGYALTPGSRNYSSVTANQTSQDYTAATATGATSLYLVHVDHLNTPRRVYDNAGQLRWRWDQAEPFGVNTPDENPASLGAFEQPLRFPGQYADKETNNNYNYFRDYDSALGRYAQSDPIGLRAGLNTYSYVRSSPIRFRDISGLAPGDVFDTESAAAWDAHTYISRIPRAKHVEFSVVIYQLQSCKYSYTEAYTQGLPHAVTPDTSGVPTDADITGDYHNHIPRKPGTPRYVPGLGNIILGDPNQFSRGDTSAYDEYGLSGYMGVPGGDFHTYYPVKRRPKENCKCADNF